MKVIIADDHPLTLNGTKLFLESLKYRVVETAQNGVKALNLIHIHQPDVAIIDINMPGLDGLDILKAVKEQKLKTKIVLLTMHKESSIYQRALELGVDGYILKEFAIKELDTCLQNLNCGKKYLNTIIESDLIFDTNKMEVGLEKLTVSERKVLELIANQKTSKQIAELLFISEKTVEGHRTKIIEKLALPKEKNALLKWLILNKI
ncbi:Two-component system response regulatory protein, LuxR family [Flavobacterium indicum GPTSA100-9 = DSM 17447]|uniref:Two-component system response regulatory protein, LuxR family n=1 Tax=Flavobacterium indicum (strain DSM 17447 / CIP 109464 / GPTSA100-9) TaxID=1094466 RepID=H8XRX5_FLAIG|nr:response regulator transcription factor [Flavobacterium indicum]CCG54559.1 Two-component system response regulatory protein, LuxR family [Flavobacterium indicum GPTSA100-9 = DSM 17447]